MENKEEKKLYFSGVSYNLSKIEYNKLDDVNSDVKVFLKVHDDYKILEVKNDGFALKYTRSVYFNPKSIFEIQVIYEIFFTFAEETIKEYKGKNDEIKEVVNQKAIKAINMVAIPSKCSALISSITMQNNGNPAVTSPVYTD